MNYLIQSSICLILCYGFYFLFFRRDTFFNRNRIYLNLALIISVGLPLIKFPSFFGQFTPWYDTIATTLTPIMLSEETLGVTMLEGITITGKKVHPLFPQLSWLGWIYSVGIFFFASKLLISILKIRYFIQRNRVSYRNGYYEVLTEGKLPTFSFFNYMFWDNKVKLSTEEEKQVRQHELAHIRGMHSVDLLFVEIVKIIFWFNPAIHLTHKALVDQHEFIADRTVLHNTEFKAYARFVVQSIFQNTSLRVVHNFNQSQLKTRIAMMKKNQTSKKLALKVLLVLPFISMLILTFSCEDNYLIDDGKFSNDNEFFSDISFTRNIDITAKPNESYNLLFQEIINEFNVEEEESKLIEIEFIIDKFGNFEKYRILNEVEQADEEKLVSILRTTKWSPAISKGEEVNQLLKLPIKIVSREEFAKQEILKPDQTASPENGFQNLLEQLTNNIQIPNDFEASGKVILEFTVDENGDLQNIGVAKKLNEEIDNIVREAFINTDVNWLPAKKDGHNISQKMYLPIQVNQGGGESNSVGREKEIEQFDVETLEDKLSNLDVNLSHKEVDKVAKPNGGIQALMQSLATKIIYPESAHEAGIEGKVYIQFVIDKTGEVKDAQIVRGIHPDCNQAAIEALKSLDIKWSPAEKDGIKVSSKMILPVMFKIQ